MPLSLMNLSSAGHAGDSLGAEASLLIYYTSTMCLQGLDPVLHHA